MGQNAVYTDERQEKARRPECTQQAETESFGGYRFRDEIAHRAIVEVGQARIDLSDFGADRSDHRLPCARHAYEKRELGHGVETVRKIDRLDIVPF